MKKTKFRAGKYTLPNKGNAFNKKNIFIIPNDTDEKLTYMFNGFEGKNTKYIMYRYRIDGAHIIVENEIYYESEIKTDKILDALQSQGWKCCIQETPKSINKLFE